MKIEASDLCLMQYEIRRILPREGSLGNPPPLPDVWYSKQEDQFLTQNQLRWYLADEDFLFDETCMSPNSGPDVYFVDSEPYDDGDYIVALLHYFNEGEEYEEPVPIRE
jgi:hypothetical protein